MTAYTTYIFDVAIVLILAFFAWRGAKKGLILTLCGLLGLFVAFFGAQLVSSQLHAPVARIIQPTIYQTIRNAAPSQSQEDTQTPSIPIPGSLPQEEIPTYTLDELLNSMKEEGLYKGFSYFLDLAREQGEVPSDGGLDVAKALAGYLANLVARAGLFALSFLLILLIWFLGSHILDLAFHLPILSAVNTVGGLVMGLVKAVLILFVLVWLGQLADVIPQQPTTPILTLFTPKGLAGFLDQLLI